MHVNKRWCRVFAKDWRTLGPEGSDPFLFLLAWVILTSFWTMEALAKRLVVFYSLPNFPELILTTEAPVFQSQIPQLCT